MCFVEALKEVISGKVVVNNNIVNGENEKLVIVENCPFICIPRQVNARQDNYILKPIETENILDNDWRIK